MDRKIINGILFGRRNEISRQKWLLNTLLKIAPGKRILDAGAGELKNKNYCLHLEYISQDFCQYNGVGDGRGLQSKNWDTRQIDIVCDIKDIPEPDKSFDAILCSEVLEHLPDPVLAIEEFSRLLKPDGLLIITAPFCSLTHFSPFHYSSGFSRYWFEWHLNRLNFQIIDIESNGNWFEFIAQELWRLPRIGRKYSSKWLGLMAFIFSVPLIVILARLGGKSDRGSEELLCFGWQILARKSILPEISQR
ncbi:MAG: class I SAM-dependent methyltransferase [Ignavibacterium sp.]|nr:MAG: class I SAM-dependent methyltransferase [Ignavibacterium sp.]